MDIDDDFGGFTSFGGLGNFTNGFGRNRNKKRKGKDVVHELRVDLEDLYKGRTKTINITRKVYYYPCITFMTYLCIYSCIYTYIF